MHEYGWRSRRDAERAWLRGVSANGPYGCVCGCADPAGISVAATARPIVMQRSIFTRPVIRLSKAMIRPKAEAGAGAGAGGAMWTKSRLTCRTPWRRISNRSPTLFNQIWRERPARRMRLRKYEQDRPPVSTGGLPGPVVAWRNASHALEKPSKIGGVLKPEAGGDHFR